jgi:hypothetical protein
MLQRMIKTIYGIRYAEFVVPLVKAVQELSAENDALKSRLNKIEQAIASTNGQLNTNAGSTTVTLSDALLEQNIPKPFNQSTRINYYVPKEAGTAIIKVTGIKAKPLKQFR